MTIVGVGVLNGKLDALAVPLDEVTWGFLLADMKKCTGCLTCMFTCSLAHHGVVNPSLSRIQIMQNTFAQWPDDLTVVQCRHCTDPTCVSACPVGALSHDPDFSGVTTINPDICIGCKRCINSCSFTPSRSIWNFENSHAQKCDLCAYTPHWQEQGGPNGKQACVDLCPVGALVFTWVIPDQQSNDSYNTDLRNETWGFLGFPMD